LDNSEQQNISQGDGIRQQHREVGGPVSSGEQLCCVRRALELELISLTTYLVAVERDPDKAGKIRDTLIDMGFDPHNLYIHTDELCTLDLSAALDGRKLSYAFFDFCGVLTNRLVSWYATNLTPENVLDTATLSFTYNTCGRGGVPSSFIESSLTSDSNATSILLCAYRRIQNLVGIGLLREHNKRHQNRKALQIAATLGALTQFDAEAVDCKCYRDTVSMMTFKVQLSTASGANGASRVLKDMINHAKWRTLKSPMFQHILKRAPSGLTTGNKAHWVADAKKGKSLLG